MNHARTAAVSAAVLAALVLAGCGGPLILEFKGGDKLNLNEIPESTPVEVFVFLLKDKGTFEKSPIEKLWGKKAKDTLGADLVGEPKPKTVFATQTTTLDLGTLPAEVRYIGVVGTFGKRAGESEKQHVVVGRDEAASFVFNLVEYRVETKKK